jgi:hypothetical protein
MLLGSRIAWTCCCRLLWVVLLFPLAVVSVSFPWLGHSQVLCIRLFFNYFAHFLVWKCLNWQRHLTRCVYEFLNFVVVMMIIAVVWCEHLRQMFTESFDLFWVTFDAASVCFSYWRYWYLWSFDFFVAFQIVWSSSLSEMIYCSKVKFSFQLYKENRRKFHNRSWSFTVKVNFFPELN